MKCLKKIGMICTAAFLVFGIVAALSQSVSAATLSGVKVTAKEKREFTKILKNEAGKKPITYENSTQTFSWDGQGGTFKKGYTGYESYTIQKLGDANVLCLYGEVPDGGTIAHVYRFYYLKSSKLKSARDAGTRLFIDGYSSKAKGFVMTRSLGFYANYILTCKNGKLTENRIIVADYNDNYYRDFNCQKVIPKAEYDKISQKYYAENAYKEIKWKPISDFK